MSIRVTDPVIVDFMKALKKQGITSASGEQINAILPRARYLTFDMFAINEDDSVELLPDY